MITIADQSAIENWGWKGWAVWALVALVTAGILAISNHREHVRREERKRKGRA